MVLDRVKEMLAERLDLSIDEITEDSAFTDLGLDSLDMAEMLMDADDEFGVTLEADSAMNTVGKLVEKIESLQNA